jgi:hypothetical protein
VTVAEADSVPFAQAGPVRVELLQDEGTYRSDVFIDDIILVILDDASLFTIHAVCRPLSLGSGALTRTKVPKRKITSLLAHLH